MSAQHTPGPWMQTCSGDWQASNDYCSNVTWTGISGADGSIVALPVTSGHHSDPTFDANARLIAAAPELLEALSRIAQHISPSVYGEEMANIALTAIAKATGA